MFHFKSYRLWLVILLGLSALAVVLAGKNTPLEAAKLAASPANAMDSQRGASGKPVAGPSARLGVVDLRALPPPAPVQGKPKPLPFRLPHGPNALPPPQAGAGNPASDTNLLRSLDLRVAVTNPPSITTSFRGISFTESGCGCLPPDGDMAVGPNHIILGVNTAFRVFNKTGTPLTAVVDFDAFFGSCGAAGLGSSDPITVYDPAANRFTVGILRYDSTTDKSFVSLAVSTSPDPTTTWNKYCFEQPYMGVDALYDFPHIGVGPDALFTTGNLYLVANPVNNVSARVNAFDKAAMYSGAITATQVYSDVQFNSDMSPADTIRPALFNVGLPPGPTYFINVGSSQVPGGAPSRRATLWRWTDPFGANNFVQAGGQDLDPYLQAVPMIQPPPGPPMPPEGFIDVRLLGATWANNTIYGTHTIGCAIEGTTTDCVQWFQLGNINAAPTLIQQGIVSGTATESRAYPNIGVDANGNVRLAYAFSSNTDFLGLRHTGRLASDPLGTMGAEGTIKAGEQAEILDDALRWGDYSGEVTDPDGVRIWHFEEYSQAGQTWGTWASAAQFPPQGTPLPTATGTAPTATRTVTATATLTATAPVASATTTVAPTITNTVTLPTSTSVSSVTPVQPTPTPVSPTVTIVPPTVTRTATSILPTATLSVGPSTATRTATAAASVTSLATQTPEATATVVPATATGTETSVPPTVIQTATVVAPTVTSQPTQVATNVATTTATVCPVQFTDVPSTNTFYPQIRCLACRGIMGGYSDNTFRPNNDITRGQLSKIVANSAGFLESVSGQTFEDVPPSSTFHLYVERMASREIIGGYPCNSVPGEPCGTTNRPYFRPNAAATRGQISKIVSEAAGYHDIPEGQTYQDVPASNTFYVWIERLTTRGIMSGYPCGTVPSEPCGMSGKPYFRPNNNATRGQTSKIVANTFFPNCQTRSSP
ncbi:MAG TPA: S-layer homology domain-containing protein [Chloroflexia bacterium]|jgi:hypothetical protein